MIDFKIKKIRTRQIYPLQRRKTLHSNLTASPQQLIVMNSRFRYVDTAERCFIDGQFWIESVGAIIVARIRGELTGALLEKVSRDIVGMVERTGSNRILVDALEMSPPTIEIPLMQWKLNEAQKELNLRRAIVVSNSQLAYLARLSFGEGDNQIFYADLVGAVQWLAKE